VVALLVETMIALGLLIATQVPLQSVAKETQVVDVVAAPPALHVVPLLVEYIV
jgi:hypothetical protein